MSYIDGFIIPVARADKDKFIAHANRVDQFFIRHGAMRVVEGWGDDLPAGKVTDFRMAVQATQDETIACSWIAWPDKATRDAAFAALMADAEMMAGTPPFDGKRMIFGGFVPVVEETFRDGKLGYVDAFVAGVSPGKRDAFVKMSQEGAKMFSGAGALFDIECAGDDVPHGEVTDYYRAVHAEGDEVPGLSFVGWPDKATRDAGWEEMMKQPPPGEMPFDGKRMFWGGFVPVVDLGA